MSARWCHLATVALDLPSDGVNNNPPSHAADEVRTTVDILGCRLSSGSNCNVLSGVKAKSQNRDTGVSTMRAVKFGAMHRRMGSSLICEDDAKLENYKAWPQAITVSAKEP